MKRRRKERRRWWKMWSDRVVTAHECMGAPDHFLKKGDSKQESREREWEDEEEEEELEDESDITSSSAAAAPGFATAPARLGFEIASPDLLIAR